MPCVAIVSSGLEQAAAGDASAQPVDTSSAAVPPKQEPDVKNPKALGLTERVNGLLQQACAVKGAAFIPVQDVSSLRSWVDLAGRCHKLLQLGTVDALNEHKTASKKFLGTANQLRESVAKAASKVTGHLENIERESLRIQKKEQERKEKEAVAKAKAMAKKAAQNVQKMTVEVTGLFAIDHAQLKPKLLQTPIITDDKMKEADLAFDHSRLALVKSSMVEQEWANLPKVQMALSAYGGQYKSQSTTKAAGKGQTNMRSKAGKEETELLVRKLMSALQLDKKVAKLSDQDEQMLKEIWLFGYVPQASFVAPTPQGLAMIKVLAAGEVSVFAIEIKSLLAHLKKQGQQVTEDTFDSMFGMDASALAELSKECSLYYFHVKQWDVLYVPAGYVVFERSHSAVLIYGMRKSVCLKGDEDRYEGLIEYLKAIGKDTARYEKCLEGMKACASSEAS